jgi:hypothetical protein
MSESICCSIALHEMLVLRHEMKLHRPEFHVDYNYGIKVAKGNGFDSFFCYPWL